MHQPAFRSTPEADANPLLLQTLACTSTLKDLGQLLTCMSAHICLHVSHGFPHAHICKYLTQVLFLMHMSHTLSQARLLTHVSHMLICSHTCLYTTCQLTCSLNWWISILEQQCGFKVLLLL